MRYKDGGVGGLLVGPVGSVGSREVEMIVQDINHALEKCLNSKGNYAELVHALYELECSDDLIKVIVVGALGEGLRDRVGPVVETVRAYQNLTPTEQIDLLYSFVDKQDALSQNDSSDDRKIA
jgi:hypothetical protein